LNLAVAPPGTFERFRNSSRRTVSLPPTACLKSSTARFENLPRCPAWVISGKISLTATFCSGALFVSHHLRKLAAAPNRPYHSREARCEEVAVPV